jgi:hypothetical protein
MEKRIFVTILPGIWQILALVCGCNSLKMLVAVVKCELALDGPTGLLLRGAEKLETEERAFVEHLVEISPGIAEAQILV